jgi:V8-like Glu-specific endopeptidase
MLLDPSIVDDIRKRRESYGGGRRAARSWAIETSMKRAGNAPSGFWLERGLAMDADRLKVRAIAAPRPPTAEGLSLSPERRVERIMGTSDLIEVVFLEAALKVARTVGRVRVNGPTGMLLGYGTGFLVSPRLLLTNWHVLKTPALAAASVVQFGYETRLGDSAPHEGSFFRLEPNRFFVAEPALDFALVAVAPTGRDGAKLSRFGFNRLVDNDVDLITEGQFSNIIQHPSGQPKQLAFRQNEVVAKPEDFLHYQTDTAPGSSGAPVYNDQWQVVALHRAGVWATNSAGQVLAVDGSVWREEMGEDRIRWEANEGVRVPRLLARWRSIAGLARDYLDELLAPDASSVTETIAVMPEAAAPAAGHVSSGSANPVISADGVATWTLPLRISVDLGLAGNVAARSTGSATMLGSPPAGPKDVSPSSPGAGPSAVPDLETALAKAREVLMAGRTDILGIRPGWVYDDNGITDQRALVVTVLEKRTPAELRASGVTELTKNFLGYPVEVMDPTVEELVRLATGPARTEAFLSAVTPEEILYHPPEGLDLGPVTDEMRVVAHVSPDAAWPTLSRFIADARRQLTGAMYEFTAEHIREALTDVAGRSGFKRLTLVLDSARGSIKNDESVRDSEAMIRDMREALDDKLEVSWVKLGSKNGWVNHDYHIKVLVRDSKAVWLSSGNWKGSGQPKDDPKDDPALLRRLLERTNREWHAVLEHAGLAKTFELAIRGDFEANRQTRPEELMEGLPELFVSMVAVPAAEEALKNVQYFAPFDQTRVFTVHPILTPDNYLDVVVPAIRKAKRSLLIQNQSLSAPPQEADTRYRAFWTAVRDQQKRGLDVRLIFRIQDQNPGKARTDMDALKDFGLDPKRIKIQKGCHTKGIVIDGERVLLGSHNLTNMGATTNRDASLLFDDKDLAAYFTSLFEHDWLNMAETLRPKHWKRTELRRVEFGAAVPDGFERFDWKEYLETR